MFCFLLTACGTSNKTNNTIAPTKYNNNENVIKETLVNGILFNATSFYYYNGYTTLRLKVTNTTGKTLNLGLYKINVKRGDNLIGTFFASLKNPINAGETVEIEYNLDKQIIDGDVLEYDLSTMKEVE